MNGNITTLKWFLSEEKGTWAFMSIASLFREKFKHRFQDDMESFYYVILYASVLWLPHKEIDDIERRISKFFHEYELFDGKAEGGSAKLSNSYRETFYRVWDFENRSLRLWLEKVLELQRPWDEPPNWTPQALYDQWKVIIDENLPEDDRIDHLSMVQTERDRLALLQSSSCIIDKLGRTGRVFNTPEKTPPLSSKRSAEDAKFEERSNSPKRQCRPCYVVEPREECREVITR